MGAEIWKPQSLHFKNAVLEVWLARSASAEVLEQEMESLGPTLTPEETLILRYPPPIIGEPVGYSLKGKPIYNPIYPEIELWRVRGIGAFDSIRFAKAIFDSPEDQYLREGADSLEAIITMLGQGFAEGNFKLNHVNSALLTFALTTPNARVTRQQYALLDKLNERFFYPDATGKHMKARLMSPPDGFAIGAG